MNDIRMKPRPTLFAIILMLSIGTFAQHPSMPSAPRAPEQPEDLKPVRIQYMMRGYFYASSPDGPEALDRFGGWGGSTNTSGKYIPQNANTGLEILVDTTVIVPFSETYQGRRVVVRNNGPDTLYFPAQDSRLYMKAQALRNGTFADIEYLPSSWCGNSYHTLFLAPGERWTFDMPNYDGPVRTRGRLELKYARGPQEDEQVIFSHEFPAGVHRKQFTEKPGYQPGGIMDPYNE